MRKKILFLSLFCILQSTFIYAQEAETGRVSQLFNFGWRFHFGDLKNAQSVDCDDTAWRTLDLPHDFQIEQPWEQSAGGARGFKAMGTGWYRKAFFADSLWKNRRVILDFEGIIYLGDVWINGVLVGGTEYGYNGFEVDITQHLRFGQENIVAVQASTGRKNGSRWYTGGGIFRDVHLVVKDKIAVARHGVYITTPRISNDEADIQVQVELEGIRNRSFDIDIIAKIYAPNGHLITKNKIAAPKRNKLYHPEIKLPLVTIENPQLWSCEKPNLYRAEVVLIKNGKVIDNVDETFGIRTLEFSPKFGFKLNGKKIFLKGISNHHDLGAVGVAAFDAAIERQFKLMKKFGYNHIRCSHNPYSTGFLKLADKYGILVVDELIDKWSDRLFGY